MQHTSHASRLRTAALCCALALPALFTLTVQADVADGRTPPPSEPPQPPPPPSNLPETPSRNDIAQALSARSAEVRACMPSGQSGQVTVRVTFVSSGAVQSVVVNTTLPDTVKSCVERVIRRVRLPPFQQQELIVSFPFRY